MGQATWMLTTNIFVNVFLMIRPSEFPSFFDDDDLKSMGVKGHKSHYNPPTATGRYTEHVPGYFQAPKNDQNSAIRPPNGLPVPYKPPQMFNKKKFNPYGRGDPKDQNIVQQMDEEEEESIFPADDGKAFGGEDFVDLDQLPKRLTESGKWDEFKQLIAEEGEKYKDGQIMDNWEDDAHMWAGYSKQLLKRTEHEKEEKAARQMKPNIPMGSPSLGLSAYWGDNDDIPTGPLQPPQDPSSQMGPWGEPPAEGEGFDFKKFGVQDPSKPKPKDVGPGPEMPWGPGMGQGHGADFNMGGPPPPGMKGSQGQGSEFFMGGAPPPGWHPSKAPVHTNVGAPPSARGPSSSGGFNMGGPPPGWGQGPGAGMNEDGPPSGWGQNSGGGMNMDGPPAGWDQGGGRVPGGGMSMDGPPPGWDQSGGQVAGGGMTMDGPPNGGGQGGSRVPGGGMSMDGPPPGWGQGGVQVPGGGMNMKGPPPGWGQGGGRVPGGGMSMDGPPPGWGQGGVQEPGGGMIKNGSPPGWAQGGSHVSGGGMGMDGPPPGWGKGGSHVPGGGMKIGGPPPGWGQGPGRGMNMSGPPRSWGKGGGPPRSPNQGAGSPKSGLSGLGPGGPNPLGGWGQGDPPISEEYGGPDEPALGGGRPQGPGGPNPSGGWGQGGPSMYDEYGGPDEPGPEGGPPQGLVGQAMKWNRRQMEENMPNYENVDDNLKGPLDHSLPQLYYKGNNPDMPNFQPGLPPDKQPTDQDDRWMLPGQEKDPRSDNPYRSDNLNRLNPRPDTAGSFVFDKPIDTRPAFDENVRSDQLPRYSGGKMPGPGSEQNYPNGYIPHNPSPVEMFQNIMYSDQNGRQEKAKAPFGEKYPKSMSAALKGVNVPGMSDYLDRDGPDYPEMQKALRMGGPGGFQGQPGPGSENNFPGGYHPNVAGQNAQRGPPAYGYMNRGSSVMQVRTPIIEPHPGPGLDRARYPEWKHMHNEVPEYGNSPSVDIPGAWQGPLGSSGFSPPGEPAFQPPVGEDGEIMKMPRGMPMGPVGDRGGPPPEQAYPDYPETPSSGGGNPALRQSSGPDLNQAVRTAIQYSGPEEDQAGFKPRNSNLPSGYTLMRIAQQKLAGEGLNTQLRERAPLITTTQHVPTKEEILKSLPQYDDFTAPIRWVTLNSEDTRDGLANVMDRKTHKNQQYMIQGELYVPIIDESMSRLGWTTENLNMSVTEAPIKELVGESVIKVVLRTMNLNNTNEQEWLAFETVLGPKERYGNECAGESCQSRCYKTGCDSVCKGDTCASGCVGVSCNAVCKGPGCFAMCIGEQCTAKCEGLNCESRCWGKHCDATCKMLSCAFTVNGGPTQLSNTTWNEMYPEYDHRFSNPDVPQHQQRAPSSPDDDEYYGEQ